MASTESCVTIDIEFPTLHTLIESQWQAHEQLKTLRGQTRRSDRLIEQGVGHGLQARRLPRPALP